MSRAVLISIKPKWCELIASGKKTIELRKTRPKLETPFKVYIYCTKPSIKYQTICGCMALNEDELYRMPNDSPFDAGMIKYGNSIELAAYDAYYDSSNFLNGKVIGEFVCNKIYEIDEPYLTWLEKSICLDMNRIAEYKGGNEYIYGWHISNLKIYDKPKELSEFGLKRVPQSWCYVWRRSDNG